MRGQQAGCAYSAAQIDRVNAMDYDIGGGAGPVQSSSEVIGRRRVG